MSVQYYQKTVRLKERGRGFHLVTEEILKAIPELSQIKTGICHVFIQHTSASLTINENADPSVRDDFESHFNAMVPENARYYTHTMEGSDDMPAHLKGSILGPFLVIPVTDGRLALGTWQGIYLCEHRNRGGSRKVVITAHGQGTL